MNGWWKFHRGMLDHAVWSLPGDQVKVWLSICSRVNRTESEWFDGTQRVTVPAGSYITSQDHLAKDARVGRQTVRTAIKNLLRLESISTKIVTNRYTIISVLHWDIYSGEESQPNQEANQRLTNHQPTANQPLTTAGEVREREKERKKQLPSPRRLPDQASWPAPEALFLKFNSETPDNCPAINSVSEGRIKKAKTYIAMFPDEEWWTATFRQYHRSRFLRGEANDNGHKHFTPDIDWLLSRGQDGTENAVKVHDGRYRDG